MEEKEITLLRKREADSLRSISQGQKHSPSPSHRSYDIQGMFNKGMYLGEAGGMDGNLRKERMGKYWAKPTGFGKRKQVSRMTVVTRMNLPVTWWHLGKVSCKGKRDRAEVSDSDCGRETPQTQGQGKGWDWLLAGFHLPEEEGWKRTPEASVKG